MDQINQFSPEQGVSGNKFKIISIVLGVLVLILVGALVFALIKKPVNQTSVQPITQESQTGEKINQPTETITTPVIKKDASTEEKTMIGIPDVSNIEITSRDESGRPTSYKVLKGPNYPDADSDGLTDADEIKFGTDPNNIDTDGDGVSDWQELGSGQDPKVKNDYNTKK